MSIVRYQNPAVAMWHSLDRWSNLRDEINTLFELPLLFGTGHQTQLFNGWAPALDIYQDADNVVAVVELPGMQKDQIEISLLDGMLTISGEHKEKTVNGDKAARTERLAGKFRRSVSLPTRVDAKAVRADYKDGILTVTLPKAEEAKPKQIKVNVD